MALTLSFVRHRPAFQVRASPFTHAEKWAKMSAIPG
jgi:hypothetical protein